ncbi:MAG: hypothetical protein ABIT76_13240 [Chthoniobacterales bacterium]
MKTKVALTLIFGWASFVMGQAPTPMPSLPPLPSGPLLKRAPDFSTWTVTFKGHVIEQTAPSATATTGEGGKKENEPVLSVSTVVKTGTTIVEQNVEANGQRRQIWHYSGARIVQAPGTSNPTICSDYGGGDIFSINFASTDFAGLDWLSQKTYSGIVKYQGNDCIIFNGTVSPLSVRAKVDEQADIQIAKDFGQPHADKVMVAATACIDLATRLPVFVQFGHEKRTYQYGTPPTSPLALPTELAGPLQAYVKHMQILSAPAARAY